MLVAELIFWMIETEAPNEKREYELGMAPLDTSTEENSQPNLRSRPAKIHYDNQENIQPQAAAVAATSSPNETVGSITQTDQGKSSSSDQEKSLSSSDQHQISVSGVYSPFSDSVPAQSIAQNPGVGSAISREVGNNWISARPSHVEGNKLEEADDLSPSKNEKFRDKKVRFVDVDQSQKHPSPVKTNLPVPTTCSLKSDKHSPIDQKIKEHLRQSAPTMAAFTKARVAVAKIFRIIDHKLEIDS
ncbi:hypothetical protein KIW84_051680 [Lathyrus oleraceus]|uniref:Uncharacterized protein n=1 Tax=Pisum sativum TaxID=3888 RepID=A0A9D4WNA7_PEA|nr:hypothetical protein KIW84_051680 [Pisum sativum]